LTVFLKILQYRNNNSSSRDKIYMRKEQVTLGQIIKQTQRLQKKLNITSVLKKITGIQKKLVATYKQNALS